ncbi:MAG: Hsp20/alpha crystallin family protein [Bacteroidia bacterium]
MTLVKFNNPVRRSVSPVFSNLFNDLFDNDPFFRGGMDRASLPSVNISESDSGYHLELSAPGFSKEEIEISVEDNMLIVAGKHEVSKEDSNKKYSRKEFSYQNFKRSFNLPELVNTDEIGARFENGILKLDIPKTTEEQKPVKKIELR